MYSLSHLYFSLYFNCINTTMISLESIVQHVKKCKANKLTLPIEENEFIQKTAYQLRINQLQNMSNMIQDDFNQHIDYTMSKELANLQDNTVVTQEEFNHEKTTSNTIDNQSLIIITENGTSNIPEVITKIFSTYNKEQIITGGTSIDLNNYYIYGLKNPESLCKSILLLYDTSFIILKSNMRKNYVLTFKKEMAIKLETYYKTLAYRQYKINKSNLTQAIMNQDNYSHYDFLIFIADYCKINFAVLDIINYKYTYVDYQQNTLLPTHDGEIPDKLFIIIKYTNNVFLPIMNTNGHHYFPLDFLDIIKSQYEKEDNKFRVRIPNQQMDTVDDGIDNDDGADDDVSDDGAVGDDGADGNNNSDTFMSSEETNISVNNTTLKSIKDYLLPELQELANQYGVDLKKNNTTGNKQINKTKKELFNDIQTHLNQ